MNYKFPPREYLLAPIILKASPNMLHASTGVGKTHLATAIAYAIASGGSVFGRWYAPQPARVLVLDGEMDGAGQQQLVTSIALGSCSEPPNDDYFKMITPDAQPFDVELPNLATVEGQKLIEPFLEGVDLLVIDNLSTLARHRNFSTNDEESWTPIQKWVLNLKRQGIATLIVHHDNKSGRQQGTGSKEWQLNTVIQLKRPVNYRTEQGARFEVHLTKARGIYGDDAKPFEGQLVRGADNALTWVTTDVKRTEQAKQLESLLASGSSLRSAAQELGISKSTAGRLRSDVLLNG